MGKTAITPTREENFSEWYQQIIKHGELAQSSFVRGCMVIKPWGYSLWERMKTVLDKEFKKRGVENAYFPLFIPLRFFTKEAKHVEGFAKECAVVTHQRLEEKDGQLVPAGPLDEPLIVRPTSETIIGETFAQWIESYRDLPLKINQWCNIVRFEMRTRLFLRTTEILWQEGHTAHASYDEALQMAKEMLDLYASFAKEYLAMPLIAGKKTENEKFPGAEITYALEGMMQDKKALQTGTSHFFAQNFSKVQNIQFSDEEGNLQFAYTTSWGVTTRLVGALVMVHGDDNGLVIPPRIAPLHLVILPILHKEEFREKILKHCEALKQELEGIHYHGCPLEVKIDQRDLRGGEKLWSWVKKGVPMILEIGPKDLETQSITFLRRDLDKKEQITKAQFFSSVTSYLDEMQENIYKRAKDLLDSHTFDVHSKEELMTALKKPGFYRCFLKDDPKIEEELKEWQLTVRCIPFDQPKTGGRCILSNEENCQRVIIAKAY